MTPVPSARRHGPIGTLAVLLGACSEPDIMDQVRASIQGGAEVNACDFSAVVRMEDRCTGFMITPRVIATAGHCGLNLRTAWLRTGSELRALTVSDCLSPYPEPPHPDLAFCRLESAQPAVPTPPVIPSCRLAELSLGMEVIVVGAGRTGPGEPAGELRYTYATLLAYSPTLVELSVDKGKSCSGDSGGPIYVKLSDAWYAIAVVSHGDEVECDREVLYGTPLSPWIPWLERAAQMRASPCERGGDWLPTARCSEAVVNGPGPEMPCLANTIRSEPSLCGKARVPGTEVAEPASFRLVPGNGAVLSPTTALAVEAMPEPASSEAAIDVWLTAPDGRTWSKSTDFPPYALKGIDARLPGVWRARVTLQPTATREVRHELWSFEVRSAVLRPSGGGCSFGGFRHVHVGIFTLALVVPGLARRRRR